MTKDPLLQPCDRCKKETDHRMPVQVGEKPHHSKMLLCKECWLPWASLLGKQASERDDYLLKRNEFLVGEDPKTQELSALRELMCEVRDSVKAMGCRCDEYYARMDRQCEECLLLEKIDSGLATIAKGKAEGG